MTAVTAPNLERAEDPLAHFLLFTAPARRMTDRGRVVLGRRGTRKRATVTDLQPVCNGSRG